MSDSGRRMDVPISRDELAPFLQRSDARAAWIVASTWLSIAAIFAVCAWFPYGWVWLPAVFLMAGRQMALAAIMHEVGHNTLFASRRYNRFVARWLSAPFLLMDGDTYSKGHLDHHRYAGTEQDPDLGNYRNYPVSRASLCRKFLRDLTGITGIKANLYLFFSGRDLLTRRKRTHYQLTRGLLLNALMWLVLYLCGVGTLYLIWVISYLTVYMAVIRMRQIAEHAGVPDLFSLEPKYNTRSLPRGLLGLLFFSPTPGLSHHCEHHLFMAVPSYHLPGLHKLLYERGYYDDVPSVRGYTGVFRQVLQA